MTVVYDPSEFDSIEFFVASEYFLRSSCGDCIQWYEDLRFCYRLKIDSRYSTWHTKK